MRLLLEPSLLQGKLSQLSKPLLVCQVLQSLCHLYGFLLDSLWYVHASLALRSLDLEPALQKQPHQC